MLKPADFNYCPKCGSPLPSGASAPKACRAAGCGFVYYNNPVPVVAAIVERPDGVVLAHNKAWPRSMFGLITGFLEAGEGPEAAVLREIQEELGLTAPEAHLIGVYPFEPRNEVIIAYHVHADGDIRLGDELDAFRVIPVEKLKPWPFGTGFAVRDWLAGRSQK
jgi:NADH pyrophosphatase NudC (nudix superfamily)